LQTNYGAIEAGQAAPVNAGNRKVEASHHPFIR